ncbi:MAG: DUF1206 domain-containing protein [Frankia sp.]
MARKGAVLDRRAPASGAGSVGTRARKTNSAVEVAGRLGFACRGLVYVIVGVLAIAVAAGRSRAETDRRGALGQIAVRPVGTTLLVVLVIGFLGYAAWRATEAAGKDGWGKRLASAARAALYVGFAATTVEFLVSGRGGGGSNPEPWTARLMKHTGGRALVGAVGVVLVGAGAVLAYRGIAQTFLRKLKTGQMSPTTRKTIVAAGVAGQVARGVVYALVGIFLAKAAITFDPDQAKGIDQSLKSLVHLSYGPYLLGLVAAGLVLFGVYSFAEARYRRM